MDKIGIKLANSEFYPILDHGIPARKRLVVTTVNDSQKSVQIDLYRGEGPMITDATYVGSLVVEDIPEGKAGEPDIRLDLELDEADMLKCTAVEAETGATQSLRVSLETLGEEDSYEIPDFDLGEDEGEESDSEPTDNLPDDATSPEEGAGLLATAEEVLEGRTRKPLLPWIIAGIVLIIAIALLGWFFFFHSLGQQAAASGGETDIARTAAALAPSSSPEAPTSPAPAASAQTAPTPATSVTTTTPIPAAEPTPAAPPPKAVAAKAGTKVDATSVAPKTTGKRYRIKWGDTLWDLAWVYYRDPWLYPRIAKANGIRNPDHILSGAWIVIPNP